MQIANGTGTNRGPQIRDVITVSAINAGTVSIVRLRIARRRTDEMPGLGSSRGREPGKSSATARASGAGEARRCWGNVGVSTVDVLRVTIADESIPRGT